MVSQSSDGSKIIANSDAANPPEMTPRLRERLQKCYEHAGRLMQQEKYDFAYAHTMLLECVANDIHSQPYLERFIENLVRKHGKKKSSSLLFMSGGVPARVKKAIQKQEWREALREGLDALLANPWDPALLRALAHVCEGLHANESELRLLKAALESNPNDPETNRHCGRSLARMGQYDQAIACWHRVEEAVRNDPDAQKMITQLTLDRAKPKVVAIEDLTPVERARMEALEKAAKEKKTHRASEASTKPTPRVASAAGLTNRQQLERWLSENPADVDAYLQLAQLHLDENRYAESEECLKLAIGASGNNPVVREKLEDLQIRKAQEHLEIADKQVALKATPESVALAKQLRDELNRMELDIFRSRKERYPTQKRYAFELGLRLKTAGNLKEAVKCFEDAKETPLLKAQSYLEMGECLQIAKRFDKALSCYIKAAAECDARQQNIKKKALHRAARLAESNADWEVAEKLLTKLVALDPEYKDAPSRLAKVKEKRDI